MYIQIAIGSGSGTTIRSLHLIRSLHSFNKPSKCAGTGLIAALLSNFYGVMVMSSFVDSIPGHKNLFNNCTLDITFLSLRYPTGKIGCP